MKTATIKVPGLAIRRARAAGVLLYPDADTASLAAKVHAATGTRSGQGSFYMLDLTIPELELWISLLHAWVLDCEPVADRAQLSALNRTLRRCESARYVLMRLP